VGCVGTLLLACGSSGPDGTAGANGQNGANGQSVLVSTDVEAAGTHCPSGGTRLRAGLDHDGDGRLEDDEVTSTTYVCDDDDGDGAIAAA
jgi:hypothetical protein